MLLNYLKSNVLNLPNSSVICVVKHLKKNIIGIVMKKRVVNLPFQK